MESRFESRSRLKISRREFLVNGLYAFSAASSIGSILLSREALEMDAENRIRIVYLVGVSPEKMPTSVARANYDRDVEYKSKRLGIFNLSLLGAGVSFALAKLADSLDRANSPKKPF